MTKKRIARKTVKARKPNTARTTARVNGQTKHSARVLGLLARDTGLRELARKAKLSPGNLSRAVSGTRAATMRTVKALAHATGKGIGEVAQILSAK